MIPADVEVADLDPAGWAFLAGVALAARRSRRWVYVLHEQGRVRTVHPEGAGVSAGDAVPDPAALAQQLHRPGVDRVVVLDRAALPVLARTAADYVEPAGALTDYRERVDELYWSVAVTCPAPPTNPWRRLRQAAERLGSATAVLLVTEVGTERASLCLTVTDGTVRRISSLPADGAPADVLVGIEAAELSAALVAPDLLAAVLAAAAAHPQSRRLDRLLPILAATGSPA